MSRFRRLARNKGTSCQSELGAKTAWNNTFGTLLLLSFPRSSNVPGVPLPFRGSSVSFVTLQNGTLFFTFHDASEWLFRKAPIHPLFHVMGSNLRFDFHGKIFRIFEDENSLRINVLYSYDVSQIIQTLFHALCEKFRRVVIHHDNLWKPF